MIGYKISINNKQIAIIGNKELRGLIAVVNTHFPLMDASNNTSKMEEKIEHKLHLGGIVFPKFGSNSTDYLSWGENISIGVGDKVEIEIVETETHSPPDKTSTIQRESQF